MMTIRRSEERGFADHGWLKSHHSFSFASYYDPRHMGFRSLRVINDDVIAGGGGFPTHPHQDMEIITYMLDGALSHKDTMGNASTIRTGEVQIMTAGTGVAHSEFNASKDQTAHLLQIWIQSDKKGHQPAYGQKSFAEEIGKNALTLVVSKDGEAGSLSVHQDVKLYVAQLKAGDTLNLPIKEGRHAWIQQIEGVLNIGTQSLKEGDAAGFTNEKEISLSAETNSHFLIFDLA